MAREFLAAFRWLRRNPLFTLAVTAILALGIGANTAIFSIVDAVLLRPLPYEAASRMVRIEETSTKKPLNQISAHHYQTWSMRGDLFEKTAGPLRDDVTIYADGDEHSGVATEGCLIGIVSLGVLRSTGIALRRRFGGDPVKPRGRWDPSRNRVSNWHRRPGGVAGRRGGVVWVGHNVPDWIGCRAYRSRSLARSQVARDASGSGNACDRDLAREHTGTNREQHNTTCRHSECSLLFIH